MEVVRQLGMNFTPNSPHPCQSAVLRPFEELSRKLVTTSANIARKPSKPLNQLGITTAGSHVLRLH